MADTKTSTKRRSSATTSSNVLSEEERAAMQETVRERKQAAKLNPEEARAQGEADVQAKIAEMPEADRVLAEHVHAVVTATAPDLAPKTWYGMPAYADEAGKVVVFFQNAGKFKYRYCTVGFQDAAHLDDGDLWPVAYAVTAWSAAVEKQLVALVEKAVS